MPELNSPTIDDRTQARIEEAVRGSDGIRLSLGDRGRLAMDRGLPYLLVYREPDHPDAGTVRLVLGEAAYLLAESSLDVGDVMRQLVSTGAAAYDAFLVLEIWAGPPRSRAFRIHAPAEAGRATVESLARCLRSMDRLDARLGDVEIVATEDRSPPGMPPLLTVHESWEKGGLLLGLEVPPVYRDDDSGDVYPVFLRRFRQAFSRALRQALHHFIRVQTNCGVENYRMLGTRRLEKAVLAADRELSQLERSYPFLLLTAPVDGPEAWARFQAANYDRNPEFHYRLLPVDPDALKRHLYSLDFETVDDPSLAWLLRDKREELDKQITMLDERGTANFLHSSIRLYGAVDDALLAAAHDILDRVPRPHAAANPAWCDAADFLRRARQEYEHYRAAMPEFSSTVSLRSDVEGLIVSNGNLMIPESLRIRAERLEPLVQHEVGTHVLTFQNGSAQPLRQLASGLADYDELQEGLAVLSEYIVGGLDALRVRLLAARVVAAHCVERGAEFVETFRVLHREHGFSARGAFGVAERVHACGGFTRDLIYLRGLVRLLDHLRDGGELEPLYIGKIAAKHIDVIAELRDRGVLREPPLRPRFLDSDRARERLARLRDLELPDMISTETP